jgi:hypothetical protein
LRKRAKFRPAVRRPADWRKPELGDAGLVAVIIMVGEHIALGRFQRFLPARTDDAAGGSKQERTAALEHLFAALVEIRAFPFGIENFRLGDRFIETASAANLRKYSADYP